MKKALLVLALLLTACSKDDPATEVVPTTLARLYEGPHDVGVPYRGHVLHCLRMQVTYEGSYVCDFIRFYDNHPDLLRTHGGKGG